MTWHKLETIEHNGKGGVKERKKRTHNARQSNARVTKGAPKLKEAIVRVLIGIS